MARIQHIAIATQDADKTARFYTEAFGLKRISKLEGPGASGYYLTDGYINIAILDFKTDEAAGVERGKDYSGLHHIGLHVENMEETLGALETADGERRQEIEKAIGIGMPDRKHDDVEVKYAGPDGVMLDISSVGWTVVSD